MNKLIDRIECVKKIDRMIEEKLGDPNILTRIIAWLYKYWSSNKPFKEWI